MSPNTKNTYMKARGLLLFMLPHKSNEQQAVNKLWVYRLWPQHGGDKGKT